MKTPLILAATPGGTIALVQGSGTNANAGSIAVSGGSGNGASAGSFAADGGTETDDIGGTVNLSSPTSGNTLGGGPNTISVGGTSGAVLTVPTTSGNIALTDGNAPTSGLAKFNSSGLLIEAVEGSDYLSPALFSATNTFTGTNNFNGPNAEGDAGINVASGAWALGGSSGSFSLYDTAHDTAGNPSEEIVAGTNGATGTGYVYLRKKLVLGGADDGVNLLQVNGTAKATQFLGSGAGLTDIPLSGIAADGATTGQVIAWNGSAWASETLPLNSVQVPTRQTALTGAANALTPGSGLAVNIGTDSGASPLTLAFANGFASTGEVNYVEEVTSDQTSFWSSLAAGNRSYLAVNRVSAGALTSFATIAPPQYGYAYNKAAQSSLSLNNTNLDDFGNTWTNAGVTFSNATPKYSGTSYGVFNGSSSRMSTTNITSLGGGSWTLRGAFYATSLPSSGGYAMCFGASNNTSTSQPLTLGILNNSGTIKFAYSLSSNGSSWDIAQNQPGTTTPTANTWYDIELTYDAVAGVYRLYVNGVQEASTSSSNKVAGFSQFDVGCTQTGAAIYASFWAGYIQGFEFKPYCAHSAGTTFTPQTTLANVTAPGYASDWFDIGAMKMKSVSDASSTAGTNPSFSVINRLYAGEATTGASAVSSAITYAYQGQYESALTSPYPTYGTPISINHNIGVNPRIKRLILTNITDDAGYFVGDEVDGPTASNGVAGFVTAIWATSKSGGFINSNASASPSLQNKSTGQNNTITLANWAYRLIFQRGW